MQPLLTSIDLFAGAGGVTEGFRALGFRSLFANEHEAPALETFRANHPDAVVSGEDVQALDASGLRESLGLRKGELSVLLGGPPCQGFSTYGQRDPDDPRNRLSEDYLRFLAAFRPRSFVMENVVGLLSIQKGRLLEHIREVAARLGYETDVFVIDAADYGVPQNRRRVFIIGVSDGVRPQPPQQTHRKPEPSANAQGSLFNGSGPSEEPHLTVSDAISDLASLDPLPPKGTQVALKYPPNGGLSSFQKRMRDGSDHLLHHSSKRMLGIRRIRLALLRPGDYGAMLRKRVREDGIPEDLIREILDGGGTTRPIEECRSEDQEKERRLREVLADGRVDLDEVLNAIDSGGFANKYRRLKWDEPSHTLLAHMARDCSDFVHPDQDRFISVREAARLQSFPDRYHFSGSQFRQFRQIGNAVPPLLAEAIGRSLHAVLAS